MQISERNQIISDFLASAHIFHAAVSEVVEDQLRECFDGTLTVSQYRLLNLVASTTVQSISEVAEFARVTKAAASKAVDRLVRRDLIVRRESEADRRVTGLTPTPEGIELLERYETAQNEVLESLFRQFMPNEFVTAARLLDRMSLDIVESEPRGRDACFRCGVYFRDKCLLRDAAKRTCSHDPQGGGGTD